MLRLIREAVAAGEYAATSEALRDAVRTWQRQRLEDAERLAMLRARVAAWLADPARSLSEAEALLAALFDAVGTGDASGRARRSRGYLPCCVRANAPEPAFCPLAALEA
jgi:antitoxin ParD1/3/4